MDINLVQAIKRNHPVVFFDVAVGGIPLGRIKFELFKGMLLASYIYGDPNSV